MDADQRGPAAPSLGRGDRAWPAPRLLRPHPAGQRVAVRGVLAGPDTGRGGTGPGVSGRRGGAGCPWTTSRRNLRTVSGAPSPIPHPRATTANRTAAPRRGPRRAAARTPAGPPSGCPLGRQGRQRQPERVWVDTAERYGWLAAHLTTDRLKKAPPRPGGPPDHPLRAPEPPRAQLRRPRSAGQGRGGQSPHGSPGQGPWRAATRPADRRPGDTAGLKAESPCPITFRSHTVTRGMAMRSR